MSALELGPGTEISLSALPECHLWNYFDDFSVQSL